MASCSSAGDVPMSDVTGQPDGGNSNDLATAAERDQPRKAVSL